MYSNNLICNILLYIDNNINKKITILELSKKFYYDKYYIMKLFKKEIGLTIIDYINSIRVYNSLKEINNSNYLFTRIALNNGFNSLEYYSEIFYKIMGVYPSTYKKFSLHRYNISIRDYNICINSISKLMELFEYTDKYKKNIRPSVLPIRKLSLFK